MSDPLQTPFAPATVVHPFFMATHELVNFVDVGFAGVSHALSMREMHSALVRWTTVLKRTDPCWSDPTPLDPAVDRLEAFAKDQLARGFPYLFESACVRLWTLLEALSDQVALYFLLKEPLAIRSETLRAIKGPLLPFMELTEDERAEQLLDELAQQLQLSRQRGVGRYERLFDVFQLGGPVHDDVRRALFELAELRNVIVHRNGFCDARLVQNCPWLARSIGAPVSISRTQFIRHVHAVQWYMCELTRRWNALLLSERRPAPDNLTILAEIMVDCERQIANAAV